MQTKLNIKKKVTEAAAATGDNFSCALLYNKSNNWEAEEIWQQSAPAKTLECIPFFGKGDTNVDNKQKKMHQISFISQRVELLQSRIEYS